MEEHKSEVNEKNFAVKENKKELNFFQKNLPYLIILFLGILPFWFHMDYTKTDMTVHAVISVIMVICIILQSIKKLDQSFVESIILLLFLMFVTCDIFFNHNNFKSYRNIDLEDAMDYFYASDYYDGNIVKTSNYEKYAMVMTDQYIVIIDNKGIESAYEYDENQSYDIVASTIEAYDYDDADLKMQELQVWFYCYVEGENGTEYKYIEIIGAKENNSKYPTTYSKKEDYIGQKDQIITEEYLINYETSMNGDYYEVVGASLINGKGKSGVVLSKNEENGNFFINIYDDAAPKMNCIGGFGGYGSICDNTTIKVDGDTITIEPILIVDNDEEKYDQIICTYDQETKYYDFKMERIK